MVIIIELNPMYLLQCSTTAERLIIGKHWGRGGGTHTTKMRRDVRENAQSI
jgi:hypothetical protein